MVSHETVYTSFDGDDMIYIDMMREHAIMLGFIPVNPEHALGYYLSTTFHQNKKTEVMKDCMALARMCHDFWVYTHDPEMKLSSLPEGVLIEILQWMDETGNISLRFFYIQDVVNDLKYGKANEGIYVDISPEIVKECFDSRTYEEALRYLTSVKDHLRPIVFIDMPDEDFKYVDWARRKAFEEKLVPLVPQLVIAPLHYKVLDIEETYGFDCETLTTLVSRIWAVYHTNDRYEAMMQRYAGKNNVTFVDMKALGIPKYVDPTNWSITTKEAKEVINR